MPAQVYYIVQEQSIKFLEDMFFGTCRTTLAKLVGAKGMGP